MNRVDIEKKVKNNIFNRHFLKSLRSVFKAVSFVGFLNQMMPFRDSFLPIAQATRIRKWFTRFLGVFLVPSALRLPCL